MDSTRRWTCVLTESSYSTIVTLDFTRCDLTGSLPTQLGSLSRLSILGLGRNDFVGSIPTQLGNLQNLGKYDWDIFLQSSVFTVETANSASIPRFSCAKVYLGLERNDLIGSIPLELTTLDSLGKSCLVPVHDMSLYHTILEFVCSFLPMMSIEFLALKHCRISCCGLECLDRRNPRGTGQSRST